VAFLRGGSQAIKIGNNTFFGLFHSYSNLVEEFDNGVLKTYMMGAYTFAADTNPETKRVTFRLTGLSKLPIVHEDWYSGPWFYAPNAFGLVDYVVYPTTIMIEDGNLFVIMGIQDTSMWIARLRIEEVLAGMVSIDKDGAC
jgi:hypothetical protein